MRHVLKSMTLDSNEIEDLISKGNFEKVAEVIFEIIEHNKESELIFKSLTYLNQICDKTPTIALKVVKEIDNFINDPDSWIRLVSLEIFFQISMYRPNLLIDLIQNIKSRFYDQDPSVRRLSVKIIGNLLLSLHIDLKELHDLIEEFIEKLMDSDWKVKLNVMKTLKRILNQDYTKVKNFEPLLSIIIVNLRDEDDDVARSAAELLKILSTYFLSKDKIFYVLLNLLYNEESRVKELIIWLFGEIGKEKSSEIIPIIPKLIKLLGDNDYRIQIKVIDALVNISENNFDQIWANLIHALSDPSENEFRNNVINALYHLSQKNISIILNYLFEELENPSENIRDGIALVIKRLYEEYQIDIENEITKILYKLDSKYWRERQKIISLLQTICFILKSNKIVVWITIELNNALQDETDPDVKEEIIYALKNIKENFKDIDENIEKINNELLFLRQKIIRFQKIPADFRERLNSNINEYKFNDTEIQLNKMYNRIIKKINTFHKNINNFEYKRLAFDLIEEWEETKVQIIEELSIVKSFITEICNEKKEEFLSDLKETIKLMEDRIDVLSAKFDYIKEYKFNLNLDTILSDKSFNEDFEEKFAYVTQIRKDLFKLDGEVRELLINNLEFNDIFKNLLRKWIASKIMIQEYLSELDRQIKLMKENIISQQVQRENIQEMLEDGRLYGVQNEFAFQLLQGHIQDLISHGIDGFKKLNDNFENLNSKLEYVIKKKEFSKVKKLIDMNSTQIQTFIAETERQIEVIIGKEKIFEDNNLFNLYMRPYLNKWNDSKELLINKLRNFVKKNEDKLYLSQVKYYLEVSNPIKLDLLSSYIGIEVNQVKERIIQFIEKNKLNAKIINDSLYSQKIESDISKNDLLFFKDIKTVGNKIYLNFKLNNPTNFNFKDIQMSLKIPSYIKFLKKESFPKFLYLNELKQSKIFKFNYVLKIDKDINKDISNPNADEIKLDLYYKDPFDISRKTTKKINLLLP